MIIKKHKSGNEYVKCTDVWVRNFIKNDVYPITSTELFDRNDYGLVLKNEQMNLNYPKISDVKIMFNKVVIISDGYDFEKRHLFLSKLPKDVAIIAVNKALKKWTLMQPNTTSINRRSINAFVVNNPYKECFDYLPNPNSKYYPTCVSSIRTNHNFLKKYKGDVYTYVPTPEEKFGLNHKENYYVDDYRNPICAAIGLAYHFGVSKLMLVCCDDSFEDQREFSIKLTNNLYTYPQQIKSQQIINQNLFWLTHQENKNVRIANFSDGPECINSVYIKSEEQALLFFMDQEEESQDVK